MIPGVIGANGTTSKSFRKYLSNIPTKHDIEALQTYCGKNYCKGTNIQHGK
jgi:hypothetical protein